MNSLLFSPISIGSLVLSNRLVRSATAERMADDSSGRPLPTLKSLYSRLADGGVGLIITGHMFVHPSGKCHNEMTGIYSDDLIPDLAALADEVHRRGGKIAVQINHGGNMASVAENPLAPSEADLPNLRRPAREMTSSDIEEAILAFAQAAGRVKAAGFDAVQIHAAHGYLIGQFLSPLTNRRGDNWGGNLHNRMRFLQAVAQSVRKQVGKDFPVLIKLGMMDHMEGGLTAEEGAQVAAALRNMQIDALEISGGIGTPRVSNSRPGIRSEADEAYFLPLARLARQHTTLPLMLVGGFRSFGVMERTLQAGDADCISICRPLICQPDLPKLLQSGAAQRSACISGNRCYTDRLREGIACKCPLPEAAR